VRKGQKHTQESKDRLREARKKQLHPQFVKRGITREQVEHAAANGLRWCSGKCKAFVPELLFYGNKTERKCGNCINTRVNEMRMDAGPEARQARADYVWDWRSRNQTRTRAHAIKTKYQVTPEWYEAKLEEQGGHCALCPQTMVPGRSFLFIDHNHECCDSDKKTCGKCVRGILCYRCNTMLWAIENKEWYTKALAYLARYA